MSIFLDPDDVAILTGKKTKSGQVDALRVMGIAFFVNPSGRPVVPKTSIEGRETSNKLAERSAIPQLVDRTNLA